MIIQEFGDNSSCSRCLVILPSLCLRFCALGIFPSSQSRWKTGQVTFPKCSSCKGMDKQALCETWVRTAPPASPVLPLLPGVSQRGELPKAQDLVCQAPSAAGQLQPGRIHLTSSPEQDHGLFSSAKRPLRSQSREMWKLPQCSGS